MKLDLRCKPTRNRMTLVGAVHLFLIDGQKDILLLRRANTGYHDGWYSVPAGHIDPGESALAAMVREAQEEIGIELDPIALSLVHVMHRRSVETDCTNSERMDLFFTAAYWRGEATNREPHKCDELRWNPARPLPAMVIPYIRRAYEYYENEVPYSEMGWTGACPTCGSGGTETGVQRP